MPRSAERTTTPSSSSRFTPSPSKTAKTRTGKQTERQQQTESGSEIPSASQLLDHSHQTTEDWYKSSRTKKGYAGYVKAGKKWILDWACTESEPDGRSVTESDSEGLAYAFDTISKDTPLALRLLTAFKCDHNGKGFPTAEGIRSAFKDYFERYINLL
jgi:hypothetical protein